MITTRIQKMKTQVAEPVEYSLLHDEGELPLNALLQQKVTLEFLGEIICGNCGTKVKKTFGEGFCFPCFQNLARCDMCIMRPETCHYHLGTCREPQWGEAHCMIPHVVYLANTSELKVGITREHQKRTRWMDQGATQALPIVRVDSRFKSGLIEAQLKKAVSDRTNWRKMLQGNGEPRLLEEERDRLLSQLLEPAEGQQILQEKIETFQYPVLQFPVKIKSHNLDKTPLLEGTLMGIKGQYLIFDNAVINLRKYTGYRVQIQYL